MKNTTVFVQGSFDLFHYGHLLMMERCAKYGKVIVGVNSDGLYRDYKKKEPVISYKYRAKIMGGLKAVDKVVIINKFSPLYWIRRNKPDVYVICEEWKKTKEEETNFVKSYGGRVIVLPYLNTISSTDLKTAIVKNYLKHSDKLCAECHKQL